MINEPLVSVIVLSYNNKNFLEECINSILQQSYRNIEIIIADDASSDGSTELLKSFRGRFTEKIVLHLSEINQGITANSNHAIKLCRGKYVAWMGSDDLMLPEKIKKQVAHLEACPECNIIYHNLEVFDSASDKPLYYFNKKSTEHTGDVRKLIKYGTFNGACSTMTRSTAAPKEGFNESILVASDWLYWIGHLINGGEIHFIDEVLGRYRRHTLNVTSHSSAFATQGFEDTVETCRIIMATHPEYKKEAAYRLSIVYRSGRKFEYSKNLKKSLQWNILNIPAWVMLAVYLISFKKIKL